MNLPGQGAKVPLHSSRPEKLLRRIASVPNAVLEQSAVQRAIAAFRAPLSFHSQFISKVRGFELFAIHIVSSCYVNFLGRSSEGICIYLRLIILHATMYDLFVRMVKVYIVHTSFCHFW